MHLSQNIKVLRKRLGLTQEDLSKKLGKTKATISDYEKGKSLPPLDILIQLSEIFQVSLDELVHTDLRENPPPKEDHSPTPDADLFNRLLIQKLEEIAAELKDRDPPAYEKLKLDELIRKEKGD